MVLTKNAWQRNEEATKTMQYITSTGEGRAVNASDNTELKQCVKELLGDILTAEVNLSGIEIGKRKETDTSVILIDKDNENNIFSTKEVINITDKSEANATVNIITDKMYEGDYIAILLAEVNGEITPLDVTGVTINEYRYQFTVTAREGGKIIDKNGEMIELTATADEGFVFDKWVSEDIAIGNDQVNKSEMKFIMSEKNVSIEAVFAKKETVEKNEESESDNNGSTDKNINNKYTSDNAENSDNDLKGKNGGQKEEVATVPNKGKDKKDKSEVKDKIQAGNKNTDRPLFSPLTGEFAIREVINYSEYCTYIYLFNIKEN